MKRRILRHKFALWLVAALILASCSQEELAGNQDTPLPAGKYPLTLTAASLGGLQSFTRSTVENQWKGGEAVYVQVIDNYTSGNSRWENATAQTYTVANDGTMTKSAGDDVYWQTSTEQKAIRAWCVGGSAAASGEPPSSHTVETNQSADGYAQSDFLYAGCISDFTEGKNGVNLQFYHQVAKLKIHIARGNDTPAGFSITRLTINNVARQGTYTAPTTFVDDDDSHYGTWSNTTVNEDITPHKANDGQADNLLATYEAIVIPQTVSYDTKLFTITADGYSNFVYTNSTEQTWEPGMEYTYTLSIEGSRLEVSVSTSSIDWGQGNTGSGEVEL